MTQSQLAGPEYTKSFISQLEGGFADPSLDTLRFLCRQLRLSLSTLAGDEADQRMAGVEGLLRWGREALRADDDALARRALDLAAEIAAQADWPYHRAEALLLLAQLEIERGDADGAASLLREAAGLVKALGPRGEARRLLLEGTLRLRREDPKGAVEAFTQALDGLGRTTRHPDTAVCVMVGLGVALAAAGDARQARRTLDRAARVAERAKLPGLQAAALLRAGVIYEQTGESEAAQQAFARAAEAAHHAGDRLGELDAIVLSGRAALALGRADEAEKLARRAENLARDLDDGSALARARALSARCMLAQDRQAAGIASLAEAVEGLSTAGAWDDLAEAARDLAEHARARGEQERGNRYQEVAADARQRASEATWRAAVIMSAP